MAKKTARSSRNNSSWGNQLKVTPDTLDKSAGWFFSKVPKGKGKLAKDSEDQDHLQVATTEEARCDQLFLHLVDHFLLVSWLCTSRVFTCPKRRSVLFELVVSAFVVVAPRVLGN